MLQSLYGMARYRPISSQFGAGGLLSFSQARNLARPTEHDATPESDAGTVALDGK